MKTNKFQVARFVRKYKVHLSDNHLSFSGDGLKYNEREAICTIISHEQEAIKDYLEMDEGMSYEEHYDHETYKNNLKEKV